MDVIRRHQYHILHPVGSVRKSGDVGCEGVVDNVGNNVNAQIKSGDTTVSVSTTNSVDTTRLNGATQYMATYLEYLSWFRIAGNPYFLSVEARRRQFHQKRQR
ncbi:hypothetical protein J1N35_002785 [Gossypium stocksii]|uniref:Uncharacterized protein n=1 Tax=Gossypium stocksii TaxID=47602 RepID=A0A9D3WLU7_9ROSI|nr:hypothetical protein J1N35_002785 [Gossypium stocksii]